MSLYINNRVPKFIADIIKEGYKKIDTLWPIKQTIEFTTCTGRTRNGYCTKISRTQYTIAINKGLIKPEDILEVVMHEILHSYPEVFDHHHKGEWARRAAQVYEHYGVKVRRTNSFEKVQTYTPCQKPKKVFLCTKCNHKWEYYRTPKWYSRIHLASCPYCHTQTITEVE